MSLHLSKCHIVGNNASQLINFMLLGYCWFLLILCVCVARLLLVLAHIVCVLQGGQSRGLPDWVHRLNQPVIGHHK